MVIFPKMWEITSKTQRVNYFRSNKKKVSIRFWGLYGASTRSDQGILIKNGGYSNLRHPKTSPDLEEVVGELGVRVVHDKLEKIISADLVPHTGKCAKGLKNDQNVLVFHQFFK